MPKLNPLLTPREAARLLGISYPTIKQWILAGKLKTKKTAGGHHRIAESALQPFLAEDNRKSATESRVRYRRVSGRNQIAGKVMSIRVAGLLAEVVIGTGYTHLTAIITASAVRELGLKKGDAAAALIKSTDVMIERLDGLLELLPNRSDRRERMMGGIRNRRRERTDFAELPGIIMKRKQSTPTSSATE